METPQAKRQRVGSGQVLESDSGNENGIAQNIVKPGLFSHPDLLEVEYTIDTTTGCNSVKISPDGDSFACCDSQGWIRVYSMATGKATWEVKGHGSGINDIEFSPVNSDILASCSDDRTIRIWLISRRRCLKVMKKHSFYVTTIKFNYKGNLLVSALADETIIVWDVSSGKSLRTLAAHSDPISLVALTFDSSIIVSGSYDGLMRLFDMESGHCLKTLTYSTSHGTATASTNEVINLPISYVELTPNSKFILSSSLDGVIRLWDFMGNSVIKTYLGINGAPISTKYSCGTGFLVETVLEPLVVSGSDKDGLLVWDLQLKELVYQHKSERDDDPVLQVALLGGVVITCTKSGLIKKFNVKTMSRS